MIIYYLSIFNYKSYLKNLKCNIPLNIVKQK